MRNAEYWRGRFSILEDSAHREAEQAIQSIEEMYLNAQRSIQKEIESWYGRFAANNQISLSDARKLLTTGQLEEFKWTVDQYIKAGQLAGADAAWLKKLENASAKVHVSRLEAIQMEIQQQLELLYGNQVDELDGLLKKVVGNGYTHTAYEVQKGLGLGWDVTALDQQKLETLISKPWTTDGRTFRDRCWVNKAELVNTINTQMVQGMLRGDSPEKTIQAIQKQFGVSRYKARRLVHTETSYFNACSTLQSYKDLDIERVEIIETLDFRTCETCGGLDGTVIPLAQYEPGVTVPPFHPNCRGTTAPYYDDMDGERAARNAEGKVYYVPANMKFTDWKKTFVDGGTKDGLTVAVVGAILKKKGVDDCTSVDEVEALMKEQRWFHVTEIRGKPYDGNERISLKGCDLETAKGIYKAHERVFTAIPDLVGQLNPVNARTLQAMTYAQCHIGFGRGGIDVNTRYFDDALKLSKTYANDVANGFHCLGTDWTSIVTHELGHAVDDFLTNIKLAAGTNGWKPKWVSSYLRPKVMRACGLKVSDTRTAVSGYATKDHYEWFAECFAEWMESESPRPVAAEFGKELMELIGGLEK